MGVNQQRRAVAAQSLIKAVLAKENLMKARDFSLRLKCQTFVGDILRCASCFV